ncbi:MAG: hypothetical protein JWR19_2841 [Pedosphaera sp.]|nr:hypothetical protein [Pedosphaera sp.]
MKTTFFGNWKMMIFLAALPFVAVMLRVPQTTATAEDRPPTANTFAGGQTNGSMDMATDVAPEAPTDGAVMEPVPTSVPAAPVISKLSPPAEEIVRMAQAGVSEDVMMAFINNANSRFNLGSDQIIYLNDLGVPGTVVKAMIQRDTALAAAGAVVPPITAGNVTPAPVPMPQPIQPAPVETVDPAVVTDSGDDTATDDSVDNFYTPLAPYGNWVVVAGYGRCWQPTVCVVNHDWRPYCNQGRWIYTDCGWYWQSDYSWGWAPFHYGRWFCDDHRGWVWRPDRCWGPSWVSWRHSSDYCGWAPLPPEARFTIGIGFRFGHRPVGEDCEFGLRSDRYTFVPINHFTERGLNRHRMGDEETRKFWNRTTVNNNVTVHGDRVINHGVDPRQVATAGHTEIHKVEIRDLPAGGGVRMRPDHIEKAGDATVIFRPHLPTPTKPGSPGAHDSGTPVGAGIPKGPGAGGTQHSPNNPTVEPDHRAPRSGVPIFVHTDPAGVRTTTPGTATPPAAPTHQDSNFRGARANGNPPNPVIITGRRPGSETEPTTTASPHTVTPLQGVRQANPPMSPAQPPSAVLPPRAPATPPQWYNNHSSPVSQAQATHEDRPQNGFGNRAVPQIPATQPLMPTPAYVPSAVPTRPAPQWNAPSRVTPVAPTAPQYTPPVHAVAPSANSGGQQYHQSYSPPQTVAPVQSYHPAPVYHAEAEAPRYSAPAQHFNTPAPVERYSPPQQHYSPPAAVERSSPPQQHYSAPAPQPAAASASQSGNSSSKPDHK